MSSISTFSITTSWSRRTPAVWRRSSTGVALLTVTSCTRSPGSFWHAWHPGLDAIDFRSSVLDHYAEIGLEVDNFDERLACYEIHIGLNHLAYNTFVSGRDEDLAKIGLRLRQMFRRR